MGREGAGSAPADVYSHAVPGGSSEATPPFNDHRTEVKFTDVQGVMDDDLDAFIKAYLLQENLR